MCGIAGFNFKDKKNINKMLDIIIHRGPDAGDIMVDENISLGHRRLSILDLSENGKQPMKYKSFYITFNGEIYNFQDIKEELQKIGHSFLSSSDTEVILHAYEEWGEDCVKKFNGMWAFCIYDKDKNTLFLSRDRFGIKPLYYYFDDKKFIFSSELKAICKHNIDLEINPIAINFFFYQKYIGGEETIYKKCFKLLPAYNLFFDLEKKIFETKKYYDLEYEIEQNNLIPINDRLKNIEILLQDAIKKRLIADVPAGSFLSGGLDSSFISAVIAKKHKDFKTFSIGFKEASYDELPYSKIVSKYIKTKHYFKYVDVDIDEDVVKFLIKNMDEPFGDSSLIPTYFLSQITKEKVKVSLSGDAGDEIFGGYDSYQGYLIARYIPFFLVKIIKKVTRLISTSEKKVTIGFKIKKFFEDYEVDAQIRHFNWMSTFKNDNRKILLKDNYINDEEIPLRRVVGDDLLSIQLNDIHNYLPEDILKKVDISSMLNSLEARMPFLDYRLVSLVLSLPEKYKIKFFEKKWFLKKIAILCLPKNIIFRKKRGFTIPLSKWIKESLLIKSCLLDEKYYEHNFLNKNYVEDLYKKHIKGKNDNSRKLWLVFIFNYWMKNNEKSINNNSHV